MMIYWTRENMSNMSFGLLPVPSLLNIPGHKLQSIMQHLFNPFHKTGKMALLDSSKVTIVHFHGLHITLRIPFVSYTRKWLASTSNTQDPQYWQFGRFLHWSCHNTVTHSTCSKVTCTGQFEFEKVLVNFDEDLLFELLVVSSWHS